MESSLEAYFKSGSEKAFAKSASFEGPDLDLCFE